MEPPPRSWVNSRAARREEFLKPTISYCGLAAISRDPRPLRLGLSTLFLEKFLKHLTRDTLSDIFIEANHSIEIAKGLVDGYIDVGCIFENSACHAGIEELVVNECYDPLVWVRAKNFVISPGAPLPILTWPGDDWTIRTLTKHGIAYKIVFTAPTSKPSSPRWRTASASSSCPKAPSRRTS
jgi:hypothetical protein